MFFHNKVPSQHTTWYHNSAERNLNAHFPINLTSHKNELPKSKISNSDKLPVEEHES
jgi:hypothetical protein